MRTGLLALGVAIGFTACAPAFAQQSAIPVVQASRQLDIAANLETMYDSNVGHTNEALAVARGIRPQDGIVHPSLSFDIVQPIGRQAVFLNGDAGYSFHFENKRLDHQNINVTGGGLVTTGPCHTTAFGRYAGSQSDLAETAGTVTRNLLQTVTGGGSVACGAGRGFNVEVTGEHIESTNSATVQTVANHQSDQGSVALGYANSRVGELQVSYSYSETAFPNRLDATGHTGDSFWNEVLGVAVKRQFGQKIQVQVSLGQAILRRRSAPPGIPLRLTNLNYQASIGYAMSDRLAFQVSSQRSFLPSNRPGKLFDLVTATEADINYKLGQRFLINIGGEFQDLTANQDTAAPSPTPTKSRKTAGFASIKFTPGRRLSTSLEVRQEDRTTDLAAFNYSDTRVTLTLTANF